MRVLVGRGDDLEGVLLIGQEDAGRRDIEQGDAVPSQLLKEFYGIEVIDQGVRHLHEDR